MFLTAIIVAAPLHAQQAPLFVPALAPPAESPAPPASLRQRFVGVDFRLLEAARVQVGSAGRAALLLNLFPDAASEGIVTHTAPTSAGYSLSGHLAGDDFSDWTFVVNGGIVAGTAAGRSRYVLAPV